jgi:peptide/nickel transport system permease protein
VSDDFLNTETAIETAQSSAVEREHELVFVKDAREGLGWFFWVCAAWIVLTILAAVFAGVLPLKNPLNNPFTNEWAGPSAKHWFGTDDQGRDIFSRVIYGSRISLEVGFGAIAIGFSIGGTLGMLAAYYRGKFDLIMSALMYTILAFPSLIITIAVLSFWSPESLWKIILVIGVLSIPLIFRVIRAATLSVASRDFVMIAKMQGAKTRRILMRELLPNILPIGISYVLIGIATVIVLEGALSFLGLSVPQPTPSWGNMINESLGLLPQSTWLALFPSLAICFFLLALNFVGDRLRSYFDVSEVKL